MLQTRPVWAQLGPLQSKVPEFIDSFLSYGKADEDDAEEPETEDRDDAPAVNLLEDEKTMEAHV